jgi:hypothetical protein
MYLLYIDPGTGSMLFAALIGIFSTLLFFFQKLWIKFKFVLSGGRIKDKTSDEKLPYVIFSEGKSYWNVFKPVCEEFEKRGIDCEYYTADEKDPALEQGYEHVHCTFIGDGNKAFARLNMLNARVLLATTPGLEVYQWKRSRNVGKYVHIFHSLDEGTAYRMFGLDFYDSVLLVGDFQERYIRKLEELRGIPQKDLQVVGCTYMDGLLARRDRAMEEEGEDLPDGKSLKRLKAGAGSPKQSLGAIPETGKILVFPPDGKSGVALGEWLAAEGVQCEMALPAYVLLICTVCDTEEGYGKLAEALEKLDRKPEILQDVRRAGEKNDTQPSAEPGVSVIREDCLHKHTTEVAELTIAEAAELPAEKISLSGAAGYISAGFVSVYPPGQPILVPGERITEGKAEELKELLHQDAAVQGLY